MGDRAVITTKDKEVGVYLHWNGDVTSVTAFLTWCKLRGLRAPDSDSYGWARLCQVIANYIEGCNYAAAQTFGSSATAFTGLSIGVDRYEHMEGAADYDNGTYIIEGWDIVDREGPHETDEECEALYPMLCRINRYQPKIMKLDESVFEPYKEL